MSSIEHTSKEIEIKLDLGSFTNYLKLLGFLGQIDSELQQLNCFYDTSDGALRHEGWALRVRLERQRGFVTLKSTLKSSGPVAIREELEHEIPHDHAYAVINGQMQVHELSGEPIDILREKFGSPELVQTVQFQNTRQCKRHRIHDHNYTFEVDKTEFTDGSVEYELEVEIENDTLIDQVEQYLRRLFQTLDIPFVHQPTSKLARALRRR